jgi:uncharacterized protein (TIGR02391 family)
LLSGVPGKGDWLFITRRGRAVLDAPDGAALLRAQARLDVDLHPLIARRVRAQFLLGEYELAALAAMREVEIRVRELAGADPGDIGVALMRQAFKTDGGPLANPDAEKGEQEAMSALFAGAIGVFKNPVSHRQVEYEDPPLPQRSCSSPTYCCGSSTPWKRAHLQRSRGVALLPTSARRATNSCGSNIAQYEQ